MHPTLSIKRFQQLPSFVDRIGLVHADGPAAMALRKENGVLEISNRDASDALPLSHRREGFLAKEITHPLRLDRAITRVVNPSLEPFDFELFALAEPLDIELMN